MTGQEEFKSFVPQKDLRFLCRINVSLKAYDCLPSRITFSEVHYAAMRSGRRGSGLTIDLPRSASHVMGVCLRVYVPRRRLSGSRSIG